MFINCENMNMSPHMPSLHPTYMALRTKLSSDYPEHTQPAAASLLGAAPTHSSTLELQTNLRLKLHYQE